MTQTIQYILVYVILAALIAWLIYKALHRKPGAVTPAWDARNQAPVVKRNIRKGTSVASLVR